MKNVDDDLIQKGVGTILIAQTISASGWPIILSSKVSSARSKGTMICSKRYRSFGTTRKSASRITPNKP